MVLIGQYDSPFVRRVAIALSHLPAALRAPALVGLERRRADRQLQPAAARADAATR